MELWDLVSPLPRWLLEGLALNGIDRSIIVMQAVPIGVILWDSVNELFTTELIQPSPSNLSFSRETQSSTHRSAQ